MPANLKLLLYINFYEGAVFLSIGSFFRKPLLYLNHLFVKLMEKNKQNLHRSGDIIAVWVSKIFVFCPRISLAQDAVIASFKKRPCHHYLPFLFSLDHRISGQFQTIQEEFPKDVSEPDTEDFVPLLWETHSGMRI